MLAARWVGARLATTVPRPNAPAVAAATMPPNLVEDDAKRKRNYGARYAATARAAAGFLKRDDGPRVAMFDTSGWDTHANQGGATGQLALRLRGLDVALETLRESLGPVWRKTVVLVATEFGRTAAMNGTRGTDHGTGAAAFLLGGAVEGGRVELVPADVAPIGPMAVGVSGGDEAAVGVLGDGPGGEVLKAVRGYGVEE